MSFSIQSIEIFGTSPDKQGVLVSCDGCLVAVMLRLSHIHHENEGRWFVEWGSNPEFVGDKIFVTLESATDWLAEQAKTLN